VANNRLVIEMDHKKDTVHSVQFAAAGGPVNTVYVNKEALRSIGADRRVRVIVEAA